MWPLLSIATRSVHVQGYETYCLHVDNKIKRAFESKAEFKLSPGTVTLIMLLILSAIVSPNDYSEKIMRLESCTPQHIHLFVNQLN